LPEESKDDGWLEGAYVVWDLSVRLVTSKKDSEEERIKGWIIA